MANFAGKHMAALLSAVIAVNGLAVAGLTGNVQAAAQRYEFEDAEYTGTIAVDSDAKASGGKVLYMQEDGTITMTVTVEEAGMYDLIMAADGMGSSKQQSMSVNGEPGNALNISEGSSTYAPTTVGTVKLKAGENTITITKSWGWTKFDYLELVPKEYQKVSGKNELSDPKATAETQSLMNFLASVYGKQTLSGQQEIYNYGPHPVETEFNYIKDLTGSLPAIRGFDYLNEVNPLYGSEDGTTDRMIDWAKNQNGIVTASWHITVPNKFSAYTIGDKVDWSQATYKPDETDFDTAKVLVEGTKENEYYMMCLELLAGKIQKLQDAGVPLIFRPLHEAEGGGGETGSWFWWGKSGSKVYKQLWQLTYKTLTETYDLHNIIWEWNGYDFTTSGDWYPGDEYVDLVAYDKYSCTVYLEENGWQPALVHNTTAAGSTYWSLVNLTGGKKMVSMAECDSISTLSNLQEEHATWLYFCPWYDGGSDNIDFLSNPMFNTKEDLKEMYTSDYCVNMEDLPANLYSGFVFDETPSAGTTTTKPAVTTTTTTETNPIVTTTTTTTKPDDDTPVVVKDRYEFEDAKYTGTMSVENDAKASNGKVLYMQADGDITMEVSVAEAGMYDLIIAADGVGGSKQQSMSVNGEPGNSISIAEGSSAYIPATVGTVALNKGKNTITISKSWGYTKFDYLELKAKEYQKVTGNGALSDKNAITEAKSLMNYMASIYGKHTISGQQEIYSGGPHGLETEFEYIKDTTGAYPAIRGFDYGNFCCPAYGSDDGTTDRIIKWVKDKNGIATASFHINIPNDMTSYKLGDHVDWSQTTYNAKDSNFKTSNAYKEGTKEYDYYRQSLETLAAEFLKLQEQGIPVIWRPLHEAEGGGGETGSWFWWGKEGSAVYKQLWQYTYKTLTEDFGCHNLIWEWNGYDFPTSGDWYPGDEYVDIVGYDKYSCTVYLEENNWAPSLVHNTTAAGSAYWSLVNLNDGKKMVAMAECDSISTLEKIQMEHATWLYFCPWYDGGSDDINFLSNPIFNTKEDLIEMYQSDYCITMDELPADLYTGYAEGGPSVDPTDDPTDVLLGDVNGDDVISLSDVVYLSKNMGNLSERAALAADCCKDGVVDLKDAQALLKYIAGLVRKLPYIPE